eukprot:82352_1
MANALTAKEQHSEALDLLDESIRIEQALAAQSPSHKTQLAKTVWNKAGLLWQRQQYPKALQEFETCLELYQEVDDTQEVGTAHYYIGLTQGFMNEPANALESFQEALVIQKKLAQEQQDAAAVKVIKTLRQMGLMYNALG